MSAGLILLIVLAVLVVLAVGGAVAQRRRLEHTRARFDSHLEQSNLDLAAARAGDRGWDPEALERAAHAALAQLRPGARAEALTLVQVIDRPGTDEDRAVVRIRIAGGSELMVTLGRRGGAWFTQDRPSRDSPAGR